jgi:hypothetical protein
MNEFHDFIDILIFIFYYSYVLKLYYYGFPLRGGPVIN